jgi:transcriptional regulator, LysR family
VTIADWHMVAAKLASGQLTQLLNVHVEGHQSYWLVTRPEQRDLPQLQVFSQWLQEEIWLPSASWSRRLPPVEASTA